MVTISKCFDHIFFKHNDEMLFAITPYGNTMIRHPYDLEIWNQSCEIMGVDCDF